ncbi:MAG: hypothetical protein QMB54_02375, partial [Neofamilia sp.]
MRKIIIASCLILSIGILTPMNVKAESNLTEVKNVVYLGLKDYNKAEFKNKDNFLHKFSINGTEQTYKLSKVGNYELQNILDEGYVYDIKYDEKFLVTEAIPSQPIIVGKVNSFVDNYVNVNDVYFELTDETGIYSITKSVGGAEVNSVEIKAGDTLKVYVDYTYTIYSTFFFSYFSGDF